MKWYINVLRKYTDFNGRARRMEFWMFTLISTIISWILGFADGLLGFKDGPIKFSILESMYSLVVLVPSLAVAVRRFHDIGKSGWVYVRFLISFFVVIVGSVGYMAITIFKGADMEAIMEGDVDPSMFTGSFWVALLILIFVSLGLAIWMPVYLFRDSQPGANKWGPNPKGVGMAADEQQQM